MDFPRLHLLPLASLGALLFSTACGQGQPAANLPINICSWAETRAAVVRDRLFIDGGKMFLDEANFPPWSSFGQTSTMYYLNFNVSFQLTDNLTTLFTNIPQGPLVKNSYYSGYMFADDFELWTYGGLPNPPDEQGGSPPPSGYIYGYELFEDGQSIDNFVLGPAGSGVSLTSPVTRYLTNGAGVSIPGEKLGFYFSGMTNSDNSAYDVPGAGTAQTPSSTLLQVDMTNQEAPHWNLSTLPDYINPRADAGLVWVPVGANGSLLVIGGVVNPEELLNDALNQSQLTQSKDISPTFMTSIAVYDIANGAWYTQPISGTSHPGQLTQFCSVMVAEKDPSSYQIYIHGGYSGLVGPGVDLAASAPNDDVWVLSVPSFVWTKVSPVSSGGTGRYGHFCKAPYPDQMLVIGGVGHESNCVDSIIKVFNLNTLTWQSGYDPSIWNEYKIPGTVANAIAAYPTPKWTAGLKAVFDTKYTKNMTIFYPYKKASSHPSQTAAIAGGVVAGVVCLIVLILAILWYKHKQKNKSPRAGDSEVQPFEHVSRWRRKVTTTDPSVATTEIGDASEINPNTGGYYKPAEAPGDQSFPHPTATSPRPGGFAEAGGGTRRISGGHTITPRSPRSPNMGVLSAQEVEGEERYEMEVLQSQRGSGDMGARHRFRDHPMYPLSVSDGDGRSQASGPSYSGPSHSHSQISRDENRRSVPSPYIMARPTSGMLPPSDTELPASPVRPTHLQHTRNISSLSASFPQVSPPLEQSPPVAPQHQRSTSEDELDALEAFHTGGGAPPFRPSHTRNLSSMSSGINQLPTPEGELSQEERQRQSRLLGGLSPAIGGTPTLEERGPLLGGENTVPLRTGDELYSPSSYSQGSTLVGAGGRSPTSRKPVGGIDRVLKREDGIGEERSTV